MSLVLPKKVHVTDCLETLIGRDAGLRPAEAPSDLSEPAPGSYLTMLSNDEGEVEGAIVVNLAAALHLGGTMIMLPVGALQEQAAEDKASEAVVDALGEIFNNLRGLINKTGDNPHTVPSPINMLWPLLEREENAWLAKAEERLDYTGQTPFGPGWLAIAAR